MSTHYYNNTSQFKNIQFQGLGADAMLMSEYIEDMEELKPFYNKKDFGNARMEKSESSPTLNKNSNFQYYSDIVQIENEKQNVGIGDFSQSDNNSLSNTSFASFFPSQTISSAFLGDVTQQAEKPLMEKVIEWGKANPGKSMLLAGLATAGGYFLYHTLINHEKQEINVSLQNKGIEKRKRKRTTQSGNYRNKISDLGQISESETNAEESSQNDPLKEAGLNLLAFFGGAAAGSSIDKQSLFVGIPLALYGLYSKNNYATCAGIGMAISSFVMDILTKKEKNISNINTNTSLAISPANDINSGTQSEDTGTTSAAQAAETLSSNFNQPAQTIAGIRLNEKTMYNQSLQGEAGNMKALFEDDFSDKEF